VSTVVQPLVAVLFRTPLFAEGIAAAFEGFADVRAFPEGEGTEDLIRVLRPDGVVIEGNVRVRPDLGSPALRVDLERTPGLTPGEIRNALLRLMLKRELG
jgi:hypothetical protein